MAKSPVSKQKKTRNQPARLPEGPGKRQPSRNLSNSALFEYVAGRADTAQADLTVYRLDPKVDARLVGGTKALDRIPAAEFSAEWLDSRHGYGTYEIYFNDGADRAAYAKGIVKRDTTEAYDDMMTPGRCKIDLRTVLPIDKNKGYIQAWTARGMWTKEEEDMDAAAIIKQTADAIHTAQASAAPPAAAAGTENKGSAADRLLERLLEKVLLAPTAPPAPPPVDVAALREQIRAEFRLEQMAKEIADLKAEKQNPTSAPMSPVEREGMRQLQRRLLKSLNGGEDDEEESWFDLAKRHLPDLLPRLSALLPGAPAALPSQATPQPAAAAAPDRAQEDARIIDQVLNLFNRGKIAETAAVYVVEVEDREDLYDSLKEQTAARLVEMLAAIPAHLMPSAPAALARRAELEAWFAEALNTYNDERDEDDDDTEATAPPEPSKETPAHEPQREATQQIATKPEPRKRASSK